MVNCNSSDAAPVAAIGGEAVPSPGPFSSSRIPQFDGLRGLAILLVLALHCLNDSRHGAFGTFLYRFGSAFRMGWAGVDLFFVLSGFLIGGILLDAREANNYFSIFYFRRFFRILPIYFLWVSIFAVMSLLWWGHSHSILPNNSAHLRFLPAYYLFLQNYLQLPHGSLIWFWLAVAWSLGVEEQFYLIAPPLVRFLPVEKLQRVLLATIVFVPFLRLALYFSWPGGKEAMYTWTPCRADSLAMGMLAALLWRQGNVQKWYANKPGLFHGSLILAAAALPIFTKWLFAPTSFWMAFAGFSWLGFLFTLLLLWSILCEQGLWSRFLRWSFLREMGRLSYCIYLIHFLILGLTHAVLLNDVPSIATVQGVFATLFSLLLTYVLASISWRFFEYPLVRRGHTHKYDFLRMPPKHLSIDG